MSNNKTDYTKSPALSFLSSAEQDPQEREREAAAPQNTDKAPEGMRLNPAYIEKYIEKRTRRVQIVLQPSLYDKAKERAAALDKSFNDYIHELIEKDVN